MHLSRDKLDAIAIILNRPSDLVNIEIKIECKYSFHEYKQFRK